MRLTLLAIGSRGDVQPLVALGVGLQRHGHHVRVVAGDEFDGLVADAGLEFTPLGVNIRTVIESHTNIFHLIESIRTLVLKASAEAQDAIVSTFLGVSACPLARERHVPFFYAVPIPGLETREFPHLLFPRLPLGKAYNALTYRLADHQVTHSCPDARCLFLEPRPTYLFCFSSHVVPRPADWEEYAHVTGYWFLDRPADWQPPAELEQFLQAGAPPVYVGFGSARTNDPQKMTALVVEALARAGQRGVLVAGWGGLQTGALSADVFAAPALPFDWLFPRVSVAVHHGGAGTTAEALRAGVSSVVVSLAMDRVFWGWQLHKLGAGTAPIAPRYLTAEHLAAAIRQAATDPQLHANAAALGEKIRREDGVGNAVAIIEKVIQSK
ncbi:MAG TPA: glycosyltransferase [Anaerolineae bacterium]|nr:glycosyltransferase [Anaerolineae bacterium]